MPTRWELENPPFTSMLLEISSQMCSSLIDIEEFYGGARKKKEIMKGMPVSIFLPRVEQGFQDL